MSNDVKVKYRYSLTERDMERLQAGEELIAETDEVDSYCAIKIRWAWTKEEVRDAKEYQRRLKEDSHAESGTTADEEAKN